MHCPDCGQQQISEETRFCSRCGLPLKLISEVVAHRGTLPQLAELKMKKKKFLNRKMGIFIGIAWMLFFILLITPFMDAMKFPGELTSMAAIFGIFSGVLMIIASAFFLKGEPNDFEWHDYPDQNDRDQVSTQPGALPPAHSIPAQTYAPPTRSRWETNDLVRPSVTEGTTKLLDNENNG